MQQNSLFDYSNEDISPPVIPGLQYTPDYITSVEQENLSSLIDQQPWLNDLKRRVQHYGYKYDYKARSLSKGSYLGPMPQFLVELCQKLQKDGYFNAEPDQVIINEYLPGQGISAHIDCTPCFKDTIASLSLSSDCTMEFTQPQSAKKQSLLLEKGSLVILSDEARYEWQHAIPARKSDNINGNKVMRQRRVSLTFRNTILSDTHEKD